VLITRVSDINANRDTAVKKIKSSHDSGLLYSSHSCSGSDVTNNSLIGRHDTIFSDSDVADA
jgi:hypothetical protein